MSALERVRHSADGAESPRVATTAFSNPFSTCFINPGARRYQFPAPGHLDAVVDRVLAVPAAMILGDHGTGKSTLLDDVTEALCHRGTRIVSGRLHGSAGRTFRARRQHRKAAYQSVVKWFDTANAGDVVTIDGFEQLGRGGRRRVLGRTLTAGCRLLVTSHAEVAGFQVVHRTSVNDVVLSRLVAELLSRAPPEVDAAVRHHLDCRCGPIENVRELWFELYEVAETAIQSSKPTTPGATTPFFL